MSKKSCDIKNTLFLAKTVLNKCPYIEKCRNEVNQNCSIYFNGSYIEYMSCCDDGNQDLTLQHRLIVI